MPGGRGAGVGGTAGELGHLFRQAGDAPATRVDAGALAGGLGGPGGDLTALVLDAALGLVLIGVLQALEAALEKLAFDPARLAVGLGGTLRVGGATAGSGRRREALGVVGRHVGPGPHTVKGEPDMGTEVGLVVRAELRDGRVGRHQVVKELLHGREVLEVTGRLLHQVLIHRGQPGGQRVGHLGRVQVLGEQRAPQRQQQVEELCVPLAAEAEQTVVHQVPVLGRGPPPGVRLKYRAELALRQRAGVGGQQAEVDAKALAGDEERHPHAVGVPVRPHADDQRDRLGRRVFLGSLGSGYRAPELHPDVAVLRLLAPVEQVGLHRPVLAGERVEAAGVRHAVQDEREEDFQCLGLARAVVAAQRQAAVAERPLLVHVVPHVDHAGPRTAHRCGLSPYWRSCRSPQFPRDGPSLTRCRGAGFPLRQDVPGSAGSYGPSTGVLALRPTSGELEEIPRGVHVPVNDQAARIAQVGALGQAQLGFHRTATRARLR